jgi:hypothetical protein
MNEQHFGRRIKETLDQGLQLPRAHEERLARARELALARQRVAAPMAVFAGMDGLLRLGPSQIAARILFPLLALGTGIGSVAYYHQYQQAQLAQARQAAEIEEIDASLLTGELPIKAYLDEDFQAWLKRSRD